MRKHKVTMEEHPARFEYYPLNLEGIIRQYIEDNLKKKDWKIIAIDPVKNKVVLERWDSGTKIISDEEMKK